MTPQRVAQHDAFIAMLKTEHRRSVFELGCGPGIEGLQFVQSGIHYTGVDLSEEHIRLATAKGLETSVASGRNLPFARASFDAVWTMSTLLHIPNADIDGVISELVRVAAPGAPIAVGLWSGDDEEVLNPEDDIEPRRFFSRRSDETARRIFERHGNVESFVTWPEGAGEEAGPGAGSWTQHYQFLVLRTPSP
ncbi:class I SAM-dependent methyltransferase [Pseudarthrobacter sp. N5]|uniref:class I SAM-dependent methyltransferase n=1 Tax=Pseudarthrobacter sp. N5 TaxID=3418416 RepID=UPI003CEF24C2